MQKAMLFILAQARIGQGLPSSLSWAASFFPPSKLIPDPQVAQTPVKFNLHTSQLIPQAPVGTSRSFPENEYF
jgi:hypothetical protein